MKKIVSARYALLAHCALTALAALGLAGCTSMASSAGPPDLLANEQFGRVDAAEIVDAAVNQGPAGQDKSKLPEALPPRIPGKDGGSRQLSLAIARFYQAYDVPPAHAVISPPASGVAKAGAKPPAPVSAGALMRNDIQDQLIAASNVSCRAWKSQFSQWGADVNFASKTLTTISSALSTAFTGVAVKSGFSAASSISSGVGSNYNDAYLRQKTTDVLFQAIDSRRQNIVDGLTAKRFNNDGSVTDLSYYTLSQAIADGLNYHDACSIESGLQQVAEKLSPGAPSNPTSNKQMGSHNSAAPADNVALFDRIVPNLDSGNSDDSGSKINENNKPNVCTPEVTYGTASPALAGIAPRPCNQSEK